MSFAEDAVVEMVFIAGSPSELDRAADVLVASDIEFETKEESFIQPLLGGSVYEGIGFYVLSGQAAFARAELGRRGFERGVVTGDATQLPPIRNFPLA